MAQNLIEGWTAALRAAEAALAAVAGMLPADEVADRRRRLQEDWLFLQSRI